MKLRVGALLAVGVALFASPGYAQNLSFGGKVGVNWADVNQTVGPDSTDRKAGLAIGGFVEAPLSKTFSVQPELFFTQKGAKDHTSTPNPKININAIEIPVLMKFNVGVQGDVHPYVLIGPAFGIVTSAKVDLGSAGDDIDIKDDLEKFDPTFMIGFGANYRSFLVEVRYDIGFRDLDKDPATAAKSRTVSVVGGYTFAKKK